jgi:serine protease inhibitor ecotin
MLSELAAWVHRHEQVYRPREARPATGGQRAAVGAPDPEAESGMRRKVVAPDEASDEVETAVKVGRARRK